MNHQDGETNWLQPYNWFGGGPWGIVVRFHYWRIRYRSRATWILYVVLQSRSYVSRTVLFQLEATELTMFVQPQAPIQQGLLRRLSSIGWPSLMIDSIIGGANGAFNEGGALGSLSQGFIADRIGRKKAIIMSATFILMGGALLAGSCIWVC